jgi:predicted peptidase
MIITDHIQENAFGYKINYKLYTPVGGSNNVLLFLPGSGELGPADGSLLYLVEKHGFPKHAKNGFDFPFIIVVPQVATSYSTMKKFILPWIKVKFNAAKIIGTGLSLGAMALYELMLMDEYKHLDAIAPVCGKMAASLAPGCVDVPGWAFHGDRDTRVPYENDRAFIEAYNTSHVNKIMLRTYEGAGHDIWDFAYSITNVYDNPNLYQWILERFTDN